MMKRIFLLLITLACILIACKRDDDYFMGEPSPFISNFDLKKRYREADLSLNSENLSGATFVKGIVISDFRAGNAQKGLLILQNSRVAGNGIDSLRGMAFNIGEEASKYVPGDSVHIKLEGGLLKRTDGVLQVVGISAAAVEKMGADKNIKVQVLTIEQILASPYTYENNLVTIANALVVPAPVAGEGFSGDKTIDDGTALATVHTAATASFANNQLLVSGTFTGIPFITGTAANRKLTVWMRSIEDFRFAILPKLSPIIISGCFGNPRGTDGNYEYIQLLATRDIDFSKTPFSLITTNNAGSNNPFPSAGWVTADMRTYKFNLNSGTVSKGEYFYVGGTGKRINGSPSGAPSTDISSAKWIATADYTKVTGADGIGAVTTNLLANSGNLAGIAVFDGTTVDVSSTPIDVIFYGGVNGNFYTAGPPELGYRVTNTEYYNTYNPLDGTPQFLMGAGTNSFRLGFAADSEFASFGGEYDAKSGRWSVKRIVSSVVVSQNTPITTIEGGTKLVN